MTTEYSTGHGQIRDIQSHASRGTAKGGLVQESFSVFRAILHGLAASEVRPAILQGRLLQKTSIETRRSIWMALRHRYFSIDPVVAKALVEAAKFGADSVEFRSLLYLYYALRDRVVFDFVTGPLWNRWTSGSTAIGSPAFLEFLDLLSISHDSVRQWRESTKIRLGRNIYAALRDFGVLTGLQKKTIQQPAVALETLFHLLAVLSTEGARGSGILSAPDWRLFLLSETQVAAHLAEMARLGWIRFERSGRVVILEIRRTLERQ